MVTEEPAPQLRADAAANRVRIIEAATAVFAEHGPTAEITMIAERAGVGVGTLYRHFKNRDDLLTVAARQAVTDFEAILGVFDASGGDRAAIRAFVQGVLQLVKRHGWIFDALMAGQLPPHVRETLEAEHGSENLLLEAMANHARKGRLRGDLPPEMLTLALLGPVMSWWYASSGKWPESEAWNMSTAETADALVTLFMDGAAPRD